MSGSTSDDSDEATTYVTVTFSKEPSVKMAFDEMTVTEEFGQPSLIELDLSGGIARGQIETLLGSSVTITMTGADGTKTYFNGIMTRVAFAGRSGGVFRYHAELRSAIWLLSRTQDCKIFQNMSPWDIINAVFKANGFPEPHDARTDESGNTTLDYCVQYRESAYDFVMRLMEQYGIYYYFTHQDGDHILVASDGPNSHEELPNPLPFYFGQTEQRAVEDHVWEWTTDINLRPGAYTHRDYNFTTPTVDTTAKSLQPGTYDHGDLEVYDYPGIYDQVTDGQKLAGIRMQAHKARETIYDGRTNSRLVRAGVIFSITGAPDDSMNQRYLAIRTVTTLTMEEGGSDSRGQLIDSYRVSVSAIPATTNFRLEQKTPKPMIRGPQTALVVGTSGAEITTEQYGRIKVQFYWDRVGTKDENSSCWIRVAQTWAGLGWGSMFIPRIGMEVVVSFLEGNPDRPLVTGVVYNADQTIPYPQPDNATRSTIKTNSSTGGGGFNELRFEDKKGSEEIFMQAQKDYNWNVLNNETGIVTQDQSITVQKGNRSVTVSQGNDSKTVSQGNHSTTVSQGNHSTTVSAGNHSLSVNTGGSKTTTGQAFEVTANTEINLTATTSIQLSVGPCSIQITTGGITISGPQIQASADAAMTLNGGALIQMQAGMIEIN
jgi:type VI secretion system secreted protein VgrG